jgi:outer membrane protein OmpA-like peptidoglycan-associated protein
MMQKVTEQEPAAPNQEDAADCAPLFQATFTRGSERPEAVDLETKVARLGKWLKTHPATKMLVEGHADSQGPDEFNLLLSYRRANALAAMLKQAGAANEQLVIRAYGESEPLEAAAESAQNRRVSLTIANDNDCPQALTGQGDIR